MRARVQGYLDRLRHIVLPPALGVGFALQGGCHAHGTSKQDPVLMSQPVDEGPGNLHRPDGVSVYSAPYIRRDYSRIELDSQQAAQKIAEAVERCDLPFLKSAILNHAEFSSLRSAPPDAQTYEKVVEQWMAATLGPLCGPSDRVLHREVIGVYSDMRNVRSVPVGGEWKQHLFVVLVPWSVYVLDDTDLLLIERDIYGITNREPRRLEPVLLVSFRGSWRILVQKP